MRISAEPTMFEIRCRHDAGPPQEADASAYPRVVDGVQLSLPRCPTTSIAETT
jgi:hypothetical protein